MRKSSFKFVFRQIQMRFVFGEIIQKKKKKKIPIYFDLATSEYLNDFGFIFQ